MHCQAGQAVLTSGGRGGYSRHRAPPHSVGLKRLFFGLAHRLRATGAPPRSADELLHVARRRLAQAVEDLGALEVLFLREPRLREGLPE